MKEKINELIKDSIEKFNVYVDDAFVDTEENKKRLNIVLDSEEIIDLNRITVDIKDTNTLDDIRNNNYKLNTIDEVLVYPVIEVDEFLEKKISNGVKINNIFNIKNKVIFKNKNNKLLGIYELDNNKLKVWKNFN